MDISSLSNKQFAVIFHKVVEKVKEDPIENFVKAQGLLDLNPTPAQEVILKVVFGKKLDPIVKKEVRMEKTLENGDFSIEIRTMTEYEIYQFLTESPYDPNDIKAAKINKINLICGRRSGKTLLSAVIAIYCAISNNWKPFLKKTPFATVLIMSHSREFSDEVLEVIRSLIQASDILSRLVNKEKKNTNSTMNLKTPWILPDGVIQYSRVQIKVSAASSKTTRGVAACAVLCDEIAFWNLSEDMRETDTKIIKAIRPSMKQFGELAMLIKLSSPGIKQGVLHQEYKQKQEGILPDTYAVFKAPSWVMTPADVLPEKELVEEWRLDPDGFDNEYRGNFSDSLSNFILPDRIDMAVMKGVLFNPPDDGVKYFPAIDAAYKGDTFTFSLTAYVNGRLKQFVSKGWKGTKANPVSAFEVAEYIKTVCKQYRCDEIAADQFSFQPLKEIFDKYGLTLVECSFTPAFKKKIYFNLKKLIHSQQADLLDSEIQTRELKELVVEQSSTGNIRIGHPNGGSDDYADSLAISAFLATEAIGQGQFDFQSMGPVKDHGIKTDSTGRSFVAPSPELLVQSGHLPDMISDNSDMFTKDPKTGKLVKPEDEDDDESDDGTHFDF